MPPSPTQADSRRYAGVLLQIEEVREALRKPRLVAAAPSRFEYPWAGPRARVAKTGTRRWSELSRGEH